MRLARMARQTSTPLSPGIIRSVMTRSGRPLREDTQALFGIVGSADIVSLRRQGGAQHSRDLWFVVDDENSARHISPSSTGSLHHRGGRVSFSVETTMDLKPKPHHYLAVAGRHAGSGIDHRWPGDDERERNHRRHGVPGRGGGNSNAGRPGDLALQRPALRDLVRLFLSASDSHLHPGWSTGMGVIITFAVSSLVAGRVAERARIQKQEAEQRREDVERLYLLSQEMMLHEDSAGLTRDLPRSVENLRARGGCSLRTRSRSVCCSTCPSWRNSSKPTCARSAGGRTQPLQSRMGLKHMRLW